MSEITFKQTPINTAGNFPQVGQKAIDFKLVTPTLSEVSLSDLKGQKVVFNIFPSIDTAVCALQLKTFNQRVSDLENTTLLTASLDLPFALGRFCGVEGIKNAITASDFRHNSLESYGVRMTDGPLAGLYARAVLVLNEDHEIIYSELVKEVTEEPDYDAALAVLK